MGANYELRDSVARFLASSPRGAANPFPLGAETAIPSPSEAALLDDLLQQPWPSQAAVRAVREWLNREQSWDVVIFALRMAVYAVRIRSVAALRAASIPFVLDDDLVDYADILVGLSIIEDCANRLGTTLGSIFAPALPFATEERRTSIERYLGFRASERGLDVMGVDPTEAQGHLWYAVRPWG